MHALRLTTTFSNTTSVACRVNHPQRETVSKNAIGWFGTASNHSGTLPNSGSMVSKYRQRTSASHHPSKADDASVRLSVTHSHQRCRHVRESELGGRTDESLSRRRTEGREPCRQGRNLGPVGKIPTHPPFRSCLQRRQQAWVVRTLDKNAFARQRMRSKTVFLGDNLLWPNKSEFDCQFR